jgi:hypothetical protein
LEVRQPNTEWSWGLRAYGGMVARDRARRLMCGRLCSDSGPVSPGGSWFVFWSLARRRGGLWVRRTCFGVPNTVDTRFGIEGRSRGTAAHGASPRPSTRPRNPCQKGPRRGGRAVCRPWPPDRDCALSQGALRGTPEWYRMSPASRHGQGLRCQNDTSDSPKRKRTIMDDIRQSFGQQGPHAATRRAHPGRRVRRPWPPLRP